MGVHSIDVNRDYGFEPRPGDPDDDTDSDEAPETPLDEPSLPPVQDPPAEPAQKGPYVVGAGSVTKRRDNR